MLKPCLRYDVKDVTQIYSIYLQYHSEIFRGQFEQGKRQMF